MQHNPTNSSRSMHLAGVGKKSGRDSAAEACRECLHQDYFSRDAQEDGSCPFDTRPPISRLMSLTRVQNKNGRSRSHAELYTQEWLDHKLTSQTESADSAHPCDVPETKLKTLRRH